MIRKINVDVVSPGLEDKSMCRVPGGKGESITIKLLEILVPVRAPL